MGMDLKPANPTADAPRDEDGSLVWGRYNWTGWSWLIEHLNKWGVNISEFAGVNDGDLISTETCQKVADAIVAHFGELDSKDRQWLKDHVILWRTCGGYYQY